MSTVQDQDQITAWARFSRRVPNGFAIFFSLLGLFCAVTALIGPLRRGLKPVIYWLDTLTIVVEPNLAYAVFLFLLAAAMTARKRVALWFAVVYMVLVTLTDALLVIDGFPEYYFSLVLCSAALVLLLVAHREFYAVTRRGAFWRAAGVLVAGLVVSILIGWGLVSLFPGSLERGAGNRLLWAADRVCGGTLSNHQFHGHPPHWIIFLLGLLGALALLNAALTLFRSQRMEAALHGDEETRIRALLARYGGRDSLGYFATRRDKAVVFSPSGKAAVTYRVEVGVCLASGDPVGDREAWGPAIEEWLKVAGRYGWQPAVMGASEDGAKAFARSGLSALQLGDEAILHVKEFDLDGREMRVTRQAVNRVERTGATFRVRRHSELSDAEMQEVIHRADAWRDTETERGFSMALDRLGDPEDGDCLLAEAFDGDGNMMALLSFVPWGKDGISLDVMRRDRSAPNGVMEYMVAQLCAHAGALGVRRISLNFAVFRSAFEEGARIGAGPILKVWRKLLLFFSKWWQLEALYRSNAKYAPEWYPRFLCYADTGALARIGLASGIAEGFVAVPSLGKLWGKGRKKRVLTPATTAHLPSLDELGLVEQPPATEEELRERELAALPEQVRVRHRKLERLREEGVDPYPVGVQRTHTLGDVRDEHPDLESGTRTGKVVRIAGRVLLTRDHGGVLFAVLRDWSGDLQVALTREGTGADELERFGSDIDLGDHIEAEGEVGASDRGELTVFVTHWRLTAKCLRPLPDKRRGLSDPEAKVRQRYVDLVVSPDSRDNLRARSTAVQALRQGLIERGYLEVETPMLQQIHGGANARPFQTHINAYDLDLYLRIAPELYLKRLCVGGMEKVFEMGRTFRNEGISYKHNPEFTMLEAYQAFADYDVMLDLTRELIQGAAVAAFGSATARKADANGKLVEHDISGIWPVKTVYGAISEALGEEVDADTNPDVLRRLCGRSGVPVKPEMGRGDVVLEMYERLVEEKTTLPTFYKDFPTDVSPLTRQHRKDPRVAERWDLVAFGTELGTAYSELTDPVEQRRRLTAQSLLAAGGDPEAMELDEDFLQALEYAMPPTGGLGIGVDRLVMFLTGLSIRETLPFPLVRRR
ncbi:MULTISPECIES: bifunctional lysylphosphatidylglycerol synthetase/lysine--tRNA ligase LysX [Streptomyces]|uniref:Lysine--tRNA ligase n=3 Tax=Streptomyces rimosus TaxID=1927 RepID=L8ERC2_STRR1|nr:MULTISPECIES: bifunctional lysylphosphatidylglycerol synthetase/lysine--tRNA ligase LysX [Streptomyces]KOG71289.1 lysine--tRNA ligase [Kitasatospora aureofaciens]MYT48602.1 bifunctional lysylphosphatidylglycerol synthetase/lysine--tRNA ligase LysX [Streptomyces sp. SID5471]KOT39208.1 lysine--tRNA ligase [Streptomyces sp. NRRL WC-3701]KOT40209.1 lysine--tRNA ligase [Streptomyces rimosus subsp. rimosus]KOT52091.1 lysine--tRNA ligase [Streptomyces rimosus subsp. rimosus]